MPYFVKYCVEQFNIAKGCETIQINNFENLRKEEKRKGIGDVTETVSNWQSRPLGGTEPRVTQDANIINSFVYSLCMYDTNELIDPNLLSEEGYDSYFVIKDIGSFIALLLFNLRLYLRFQNLETTALMHLPLNIARSIQVELLYHGLCKYTDNESGKHEKVGHPRAFNQQDLIDTIITKHSDFRHQREYRIVFVASFTNADTQYQL